MALDPASMTPQQFMGTQPAAAQPSTVLARLKPAAVKVGQGLAPLSRGAGGLIAASGVADMVQNGPSIRGAVDVARGVGQLASPGWGALFNTAFSVGQSESVGDLFATLMGGSEYTNLRDANAEADKRFAALAKQPAAPAPASPAAPQAPAPAPFPQESANKAADSFIDGVMGGAPAPKAEAPAAAPQAPAADPLAGIRQALTDAAAARAKVANPLNTEVNVDQNGTVTDKDGNFKMQMRDAGGNPFAALAGLQQAIGLARPQQLANKQAKADANDLLKLAEADAGLVKLADTLSTSALARDKTILDTEEGKLKLDQARQVKGLMDQLAKLDPKAEGADAQRTALERSILTLLGKEPRDRFQAVETGGGEDETGRKLPKSFAVVDKQTGASPSPYPEGFRLTGRDGNPYVVKNGIPVLVQ